ERELVLGRCGVALLIARGQRDVDLPGPRRWIDIAYLDDCVPSRVRLNNWQVAVAVEDPSQSVSERIVRSDSIADIDRSAPGRRAELTLRSPSDILGWDRVVAIDNEVRHTRPAPGWSRERLG